MLIPEQPEINELVVDAQGFITYCSVGQQYWWIAGRCSRRLNRLATMIGNSSESEPVE